MKSVEHIRDCLDRFATWASAQEGIQAIALVGSYARGEARDDFDIDLALLTEEPQRALEDLKWINRFDVLEKHQTEDYGKLISIRVWYQNEYEVEYGLTKGEPPTWRNLSHYLSKSFAAIRMSAFSLLLIDCHSSSSACAPTKLIIKDLPRALHLLDYLLPVKRLHSLFSFLLPGGVTDLQIEVLYN